MRTQNISHLSNISYMVLFFLPLLPGAGIFSTFNGSIFWIIFSLTYITYKKENLNLKKKYYNKSTYEKIKEKFY